MKVIRTYLSIVGLFNLSASLIWGVNTLFLLEAGLTLTQTFIANAFFTLGMVLFEIPTGVVADTLGRRTSFLASLVILTLSTLAYLGLFLVEGGIVAFSVASIFLGLGFTFYTGAVEAWVVDAMAAEGETRSLESVFARGGQVQGIAMLVGTLSGGLLATFSLAVPYLVRAGLLIACFVLAAAFMRDQGFTPRAFDVSQIPAEMREVTRTSLRDGWRRPEVRNLLLAGTVFSTFLIWAWYAWQPLIVDLAGGAVWVAGAVAAAVSIAMIIGAGLAPVLSRKTGDRASVMLMGTAFAALGFAGVSYFDTFWPVLACFLAAMIAVGTLEPIRGAMVHHLVPSRTRATIISFGGMLASAGGTISQVALAAYAEATTIQAGYAVGALWCLLAVPFVIMAVRRAPEVCDPIKTPEPAGPAVVAGVVNIDT